MRRTRASKLLRIALVVLAVPLLAASICYLKWSVLDGRLVTITPGKIYQSAAFSPDALLATCQDYGIKTVIDLRDTKPKEVAAAARIINSAGLHHVHLPTVSHPTPETAQAFLVALSQAERPVLVHCQHGEGRSVMLCAIHRIVNEGWSNERAFNGTARLPDSLRFVNSLVPSLRRLGTDSTKGRFVLNYVPSK